MQPIVYIDMLFLLNLLMNSVILYAAALFLRKDITALRLLLTAALSALYSSVMFFSQISVLYSGFFKILFWILTTLLVFPSKNPKEVLKSSVVFLAVNLVFGGIVFVLIFATDFGTSVGSVVSNGEIYLDISFGTLLFSAATAYAIIYIISYIKKQNIRNDRITADITVIFKGKAVTFKALCDTGCSLCDPLSGFPAVIISPQTAKKLIPTDSIQEAVQDRYRILPFCTVNEEKSFLHGFVPDKLFIQGLETTDAVVGISRTEFSQFSGIFNPALLENKTNRKAVTINNETKTLV